MNPQDTRKTTYVPAPTVFARRQSEWTPSWLPGASVCSCLTWEKRNLEVFTTLPEHFHCFSSKGFYSSLLIIALRTRWSHRFLRQKKKKKTFEQHTLQSPFSVGFGGEVGLFGLQCLCGSQPAWMVWLNSYCPPPPLASFKGCCGHELIFSSWVAITMSVAVSLILLSLLFPLNNEDYYWRLALLRGAWQLREHCNLR